MPHYLPGKNEFIQEFTAKYAIPPIAARGGAATMYPEFMAMLKQPVPAASNANLDVPQKVPDAAAQTGIHSLHVAGQVWMISGGGANTTVQVGDEGVLVVDPGREQMADAVIAEIRKIAGDKPIRIIVNTEFDPEHSGANEKVAAGSPKTTQKASMVSTETAVGRMAEAKVPVAGQPNDTFFGATREMYFNGEPVVAYAVPDANTDTNAFVVFRKSDVISAGDIVDATRYPIIRLDQGGTLNGVIEGINRLVDLAVARGQGDDRRRRADHDPGFHRAPCLARPRDGDGGPAHRWRQAAGRRQIAVHSPRDG